MFDSVPEGSLFAVSVFSGLLVFSSACSAPLYENVSETHLPALMAQSKDAKFADVDNDGDLDVFIAHEYKANILLINNGSGRFSNESESRLPQIDRDSEDIAVGDFDGDGDIDVLFVSEDDEENELYFNDGAGNFTDATDRLPVKGVTNGVAAADINGDGFADIVFGNGVQNAIILGDGAGEFRDETAKRLPMLSDATQDVEFGDADGDLDLLVANEDQNRLLINDGNGVFTDESLERLAYRGLPEETREADFGDIDGDGDLDIYFANVNFRRSGDPRDRLLVNDGEGFFSDETADRLPSFTDYTMDADFIDIDADGDADIVTAGLMIDKGLSPVLYRVFENDGAERFSDASARFFGGVSAVGTDIETGDVNSDGRMDIFLTNRSGADFLLINTGGKNR